MPGATVVQRWPNASAALSYLALSLVFLAPLSLNPLDRVAYVGDSISFIYFPIENVSRLFADPAHLAEAPVAFPHPSAALFEALRLGFGLFMAPASWLTGNPVLAANTATVLVYLANAMAARWMGATLGVSPLGAWFSGALFAFHTYSVNEQPRPHILFHALLPVAVVHLVKLLRGGPHRHAWVIGATLAVQSFFENYVVVFGLVLLTATYALFLLSAPRDTLRRTPALVLPALVCALAALPMLFAYSSMDRIYDYSREAPASMDAAHYWATPATNILYGGMGAAVRRQQMGPHFIGFATAGLIVAALATARRGPERAHSLLPARTWVPAAFLLMLLFVLLSLGREVIVSGIDIGPGPFGFLYDRVPVFQVTRIPERYSILAMLFAALLAGRALTVLRISPWARIALVTFGLGEHAMRFPSDHVLPPFRDYPAVYHWLKDAREVRAIAEVPIHGENLVRFESLDMYFGMLHEKPIISGYLSFEPLLTRILRQVARDAPAAEALEALKRVGVDTLVVHEGRGGGAETMRLALSARDRGDLRLLAEFPPQAGTLEPGRDTVFSILRPPSAPAPLAQGQRLHGPAWRWVASEGLPELAGDGEPGTRWVIDHPLTGGEFLQVNFRGEAVRVQGLVLPLTRKDCLPSDFIVEGRDTTGVWTEVARYLPGHRLQLIESLLKSPGRAELGFDLGGLALTGIRLRAAPGATSFDGWRVSELEVRRTGP